MIYEKEYRTTRREYQNVYYYTNFSEIKFDQYKKYIVSILYY